jgi:hypothetical protein
VLFLLKPKELCLWGISVFVFFGFTKWTISVNTHVCSMEKPEVSAVLSTNGGKGSSSRKPNHHADGVNILFNRILVIRLNLVFTKFSRSCYATK